MTSGSTNGGFNLGLGAFSLGTISSKTPALAEQGRVTNKTTTVINKRRVKAGKIGSDFIVPSVEACNEEATDIGAGDW